MVTSTNEILTAQRISAIQLTTLMCFTNPYFYTVG
jgi:hypothetical protein